MKRLLSTIIFLSLILPAICQDHTEEFYSNGLKVIVKKVPRDIISVAFVIRGGTSKYSKEDEGIENLAIKWAVEGGTINYPKNKLNQQIESLGTRIDFYTGYDYSVIEMTCLRLHWAESWKIFSDILTNPAFVPDQFKLAKSQLMSDAKYNNQDPDTKLRYLSMTNVFGGMNYDIIPQGSTKSLTELKMDQVKNYYKKELNRDNCFLAIVGNMEDEVLKNQLSETLSDLASGSINQDFHDFSITQGSPQMHYKSLETNYIRGYMNAPHLESEDGLAMLMAINMLDKRIFDIVRVREGLSYNPTAFFANSVINYPYNVLYISTSKPKEAIKLMVEVLDDVRENGFTAEELSSQKATYLTENYLDQETTSSQCIDLMMNELRSNWQNSVVTPDKLSKINSKTINDVMRKYFDVIRWTYFGNKNLVGESDFIQPKNLVKN